MANGFSWGWLIGTGKITKPVCSYTCQRKWERNPALKINPLRKKVKIRIVETGEEFNSIAECVRHLNGTKSVIYRCIEQKKVYKGLHIERVVE